VGTSPKTSTPTSTVTSSAATSPTPPAVGTQQPGATNPAGGQGPGSVGPVRLPDTGGTAGAARDNHRALIALMLVVAGLGACSVVAGMVKVAQPRSPGR
jgi:hypothetical protein